MASLSYWFLSPSLILAVAGKLRGWDRTVPTPAVDWRKMTVDAVIPAKNEETSIAVALASIFQQDFPVRRVVVFDDASTDHTSAVVRRYEEVTGHAVQLVTRTQSIGKTPALREFCAQTDADAIFILDADSVLVSRNYISRAIEELFRNAGVAAACGEVMPLSENRNKLLAAEDVGVRTVAAEFPAPARHRPSFWKRMLTRLTVCYRAPMYVLLQRTLYDGNLKLFGAQLNPVGCAVAYRTSRLRECFEYAGPRIGDNLSDSEDIYIGHFFNWKGYRNFQVLGVRCETTEPPIHRLPRQLFLWSSGFLQSTYYFGSLLSSPLRQIKKLIPGYKATPPEPTRHRKIQEQYRAAWGEAITRKEGRPIGWLELISLVEKMLYPLVLLYLGLFNHEAFWITLGAETLLCMGLILATADRGYRLRYAAMLVPALPVRVMSLGVDLLAAAKCVTDIATGNREWRK